MGVVVTGLVIAIVGYSIYLRCCWRASPPTGRAGTGSAAGAAKEASRDVVADLESYVPMGTLGRSGELLRPL